MWIFFIIIFLLSIQFFISYFWVHFGVLILLSQSKPWIMNFTSYTDFGHINRSEITFVWTAIMVILFLAQIFFLNSKFLEKYSLKKLFIFSWIVVGIAGLSYNFLSSDIFSYLFTSKMVTFFHANPFVVKPDAFMGKELWLPFTLWISSTYYKIGNITITYPYGPVAILYNLIPFLIFTANRFLGVYFGLKLLNITVFMLCGWMLLKINKNDKKVFAYWFFNPLLLLELLVNSHNDLIMIAFFIAAMFFETQKKKCLQILSFLLSVGTKFVSGPLIFSLFTKGKFREFLFKASGFGLLFLEAYKPSQIWYYTWVYFAFLFANLKKRTWTTFFSLQIILIILAYYKFVICDQWGLMEWMPSQNIFRWGFPILMLIMEINWKYLSKKTVNLLKKN